MPITTATQGSSLADILERVLDKGIVIAGDITIGLADIELLKIRIRLLVASVDKAEQIGVNWWRTDPAFGQALGAGDGEVERLRAENDLLRERLALMEQRISLLAAGAQVQQQAQAPQDAEVLADAGYADEDYGYDEFDEDETVASRDEFVPPPPQMLLDNVPSAAQKQNTDEDEQYFDQDDDVMES